MRKKKEDSRYFNFPITLLKNFLHDSSDYKTGHLKCFLDIQMYAYYAQAKKYDSNLSPKKRISMCETYFGDVVYAEHKDYFYRSKKLYYEFNKYNGKNPVMVGINIDRLYDYITKEKTVDEKIHLLGYLAIKSIIGNQKYKKTTINYVLSRMDGKTKTIKSISELSPELIEYFGTKKDEGKEIIEYRWNKFIEVLQDEWYLHYYAKKMRGFLVSFDLTKEALIDKAVDKRPSSKKQIRKLKEKELERKALEKRGLIKPTKPEPTKDSQKDEIKVIDIQQSDIEDDKKDVYDKSTFLQDWNILRTKHLKKPTYLNSINAEGLELLNNLSKDYKRDDFTAAMVGLFKQQKFPNDNTTMQSNPIHFLKFFNSYLTAFHDMNDKLYGVNKAKSTRRIF